MTPVDLNRLREALRFVSVTDAEQDCLRETGEAVLDAPHVWWCAELEVGGKDEGTFADGTCTVKHLLGTRLVGMVDPDGTDVCGLCVRRWKRKQAKLSVSR